MEEGWSHIIGTIGRNQEEKAKMKKERPVPEQTILKEFEESKMNGPDYNLLTSARGIGKPNTGMQGQNQATRGTQMTTVPTQPMNLLKPTQPTGGITPMGNDKGPMKMVNDNVTNAVARKVQGTFNVGPNGTNNMTGLSNKTPEERLQINKHISAGIGGKTHDPYSASPDYGPGGAVTRAFKTIGSFQGLEDENHVGNGIDLDEMFQDSSFKKQKPVEVACGDKKGMFITSEKKK